MNIDKKMTRADLIHAAMAELELTYGQAVEYVMERSYNQMSHKQAMSELRRKGIIQ